VFKDFIDDRFSCLNLISMMFHQFKFYYEHISFTNPEHCQKMHSLTLSNEEPFKQIERFFPMINVYTNLKQLHLYSPNANQLESLSRVVPNLSELYLIFKNEKLSNINWLSSLQKLEICSIDCKYFISLSNQIYQFEFQLKHMVLKSMDQCLYYHRYYGLYQLHFHQYMISMC
jgi:Leucine-rich repeat (LRR) protein